MPDDTATLIAEIRARDESIHQCWFDICERVLRVESVPDAEVPDLGEAHTALAIGDRRALLRALEQREREIAELRAKYDKMHEAANLLGDMRVEAEAKVAEQAQESARKDAELARVTALLQQYENGEICRHCAGLCV